MKTINWLALPNCPEGQLQKANDSDAGWDLKITDTTLVKPYSELPTVWKDFKVLEEVQEENPNLITPETVYAAFSQQQGIRLKDKLVVTFEPSNRSAVWVNLNKLGCTDIADYKPGSILVDAYCDIADIRAMKEAVDIYTTAVIQRREYKPTLIGTGIKLNPQELGWSGLFLRSSATKLGIAMPHSVGVIDFKQ